MIKSNNRRRAVKKGAGREHHRPAYSEPLEARRLLYAGDLDRSFNDTGYATADFGTGTAGKSTALVVQADGKTVVVGAAGGQIAVARFQVDGTLDPSFGPAHNGTLVTRIDQESGARDVAVQDDGKIVVVGYAGSGSPGDFTAYFVVVRYNPDGTLDPTFDGDGKKGFDFGFSDQTSGAHAVTVEPGGKILVAGGSLYGAFFGQNEDFAFARLNPNGSFDDSFDGDGKRVIGMGDWEELDELATDFSGTPATNPYYGTIVAVGTRSDQGNTYNEMALMRLRDDGSLDSSFDGDGQMTLKYGNLRTSARGVVIQSGGRIVVGGTAGDDMATARLQPSGVLDPSFGTGGGGWRIEDLGGVERCRDLIARPDGGLVLGGISVSGEVGQPLTESTFVVGYNADGQRDASFGVGGLSRGPSGGLVAMAPGPGRRFVTTYGNAFLTARFLDAGANVVYATTLNTVASESGPTARGFVVYRTERLPYATRVYFDVSGTATAPYFRVFNRDYNVDGMVFPNPFFGDSDVPYVDIPANQTFINVVMTPVDDALAEGNETAAFYIRGDASYEQGRPSGVTMTIVDNDAPPPSVAAVYVRGSAWKGGDDSDNVTFKEYLAGRGLGDADYGFRLDNAPAGTVLPWTNVDQVVLRYTAPPTGSANPTAAGVVLQGTRSGYAIASAQALDPRTFLLTLDRPLGTQPSGDGNGDRLRLAVPGGAAGGPYELRFGVLPGDVDGSGQVLAADFSDVKRRFFKETNTPPGGAADYDAYHDVNGDGVILADDFSAVKKRFFDDLPPAAAAALGTGTPITNQLLRTPTKRTEYR